MMKQLKTQIQLHEARLNRHKHLWNAHRRGAATKTRALVTAPITLAAIFGVSLFIGASKKTQPKQVASLAERLSTVFTLYRLWQKYTTTHKR